MRPTPDSARSATSRPQRCNSACPTRATDHCLEPAQTRTRDRRTLEAAWQTSARIVDAVGSSFPTFPSRTLAWLARLMEEAGVGGPGLRNCAARCSTPCPVRTNIVIFSHYVAINAAVGAALGHDEFEPFQPANASGYGHRHQRGRYTSSSRASRHHRPPSSLPNDSSSAGFPRTHPTGLGPNALAVSRYGPWSRSFRVPGNS